MSISPAFTLDLELLNPSGGSSPSADSSPSVAANEVIYQPVWRAVAPEDMPEADEGSDVSEVLAATLVPVTDVAPATELTAAPFESPLLDCLLAKLGDGVTWADIITPTTLVATYTSGVQDVFSFGNWVGFRDNGQWNVLRNDDADMPEIPDDPFNIDLHFYGQGWSSDLLGAFTAAAEFLSDMITTGLPTDTASSFVAGGEEIEIDDLLIEASLVTNDGASGIVGGGVPRAVRSSDGVTPDGLPVLSTMTFDIDDAQTLLAQGIWDDVVLHEMIHALGFGTPIWSANNLAFGFVGVAGSNYVFDQFFVGEGVAAAVAAEGGIGAPKISGPLFFDPAAETIQDFSDGHWDEIVFGNALMTPTLSTEGNFLTDMTLASLGDMGYVLAQDYSDPTVNNPLSAGIDLEAQGKVSFAPLIEEVVDLIFV